MFFMDSNESLFHCVATGYPEVQVSWESGLGQNLLQSSYNISVEEQDFNITLTSTLSVDDEACREARGYACVFHNGGSPAITRSAFMHCPPGNTLWCTYIGIGSRGRGRLEGGI